MKTFIGDVFPKIQSFSKKLDALTILTNQHWVLIDNIVNNKTVYIFRSSNELLISTNGRVEKAKWEYLENEFLLIDRALESTLLKQTFYDENILALKMDNSNEYAVFVNGNNYDKNLDSIERIFNFLKEKYLEPKIISDTGNSTQENFFRGRISKQFFL